MNAPQRWAYFAGFLFPFFLMAQTFPGGEQDSVYIQKYKTIKTGFARGNFENSHDIGEGSGCSRTGITEYFEQKYTLAAVALEFTEINPAEKYQLSYGAKAIMGNHRETRISDGRTKNTTLAGITPYGTYELNWLGVGGGLHLGNLSYITENLEEDGLGRPESGSKHTFIYPQAYVRFGPRRWLFADYHLAHHFPSALPGFRQQIGIGTGLGTRNGTNLRLGFNSNDITYLSGYFPIKNKVVLEPMLLWGKLYRPNNENPRNGYQFSLGVSYRFGFSEQKQEVRK